MAVGGRPGYRLSSTPGRRRRRNHGLVLAAGIVLVAGCAAGPVDRSGAGGPVEVTVTATTTVPAPVVIAPTSSAAPRTAPAAPAGPPLPAAPAAPTDAGAATGNGSGPACPGVRCVSLVITGDVLLHPDLVDQARVDGGGTPDFFPLLAAQQPYVAGADLAVCHLETPLAPAEGPFHGYPSFSVPPQVLPALVRTGYDACSTASNHTLDRGTEGLDRTLDALDAAGLAHDGSYRTAADAVTPVVLDGSTGRVGLISVTYGLNGHEPEEPWRVGRIDTDAIVAGAARARAAGADLVVVAVHAGTEYEPTPNPEQEQLARELLADPGIDLVYGHHAHVVQPMERIGGKWAIHGLGNAVAAQSSGADGIQEGLLVRVQFSQAADGTWSTSDVAWVASHQSRRAPYRWCALSPTDTCGTDDPGLLAGTTDTVNSRGADTHGARRLN
ncbi:poly-gamma-glutamate synthesis protein (capsule biosynthesis protein) [Nakamurella flavida]|uniref:CapA family protein n=1 Tax=Nakamurella flavida TaxID=363630 RepID=UPI00278164CA|nr:CapA family protein [Nakamurella flavida]MDP9778419.1 poly-gamma-glutamate synthesis protein (capsule biosynthesis protein) [Nakamurella flavida]